jgi:hypothetical protein
MVKLPNDDKVSFCAYCYDSIKKKEMCDFCFQVYFGSDVDGQMWIGCDSCDHWNHPQCEVDQGPDPDYKAAALESIQKGQKAEPDSNGDTEMQKPDEEEEDGKPYLCMKCRKCNKKSPPKGRAAAAKAKVATAKAKPAAPSKKN